MLTLKLLGPPQIYINDLPVKFATRKALALFTYLVVESGPHPRSKLMDLFWPESATHLAQPALRNTLARIKEALRAVGDPLRLEGDRVSFWRALPYSLDLEQIAQTGEAARGASITPESYPLLQRAADLARFPFMDGFSLPDAPGFDDWLRTQREIWEERQSLLCDRLSLHQLETHRIQPAVETVLRWLHLQPTDESAHRRLIRLRFLDGNRSAALEAYDQCRAVLARELAVEPSPETEAVVAHIRATPAPAPLHESEIVPEHRLGLPFVGRAQEYRDLIQSFRAVKQKQPQVVVLSGESGIGKTRLSEEFLRWAGTEGADILRGRAFEIGGRLPYQPVIDALGKRVEAENAPDDLLDDIWLAELSRILPELRARYPDLPHIPGDDPTARTRLFEAVVRLVEALATRKPLIWLMDDLQWADEESLDLLRYLTNQAQSRRLAFLLLILVRSEALGYGARLREWMGSLTFDTAVNRISLSAMSFEEVHQLLLALAGEDEPGLSELATWFAVETAGQPFFLGEVLAALEEAGALVWRVDASGRRLLPLPTLSNLQARRAQTLLPAIRDVVLARLEWLSQPAAALLSAAAVIGRACTFARLCGVSGMGEQESLNALDELLLARMLVEARKEARPYAVAHDRIREIAYAQLSDARRQIFHRRALDSLTQSGAPSAELAFHALAAKEWRSAFVHSLEAGDQSLHLFATAGAIHHYETARTLLHESRVEISDLLCQRLYTQLASANQLAMHHREVLAVYEEMEAHATRRGSQEMKLAALVGRALLLPVAYDTQNLELARQLATEALPLAQALNDRKAQAEIEMALAWNHKFGDGQLQPTIHHLQAAEGLARETGLQEQLGFITLELGVASIFSGQTEAAESYLLESMGIYRKLEHRPKVVSCLHNLAIIHMASGRFESAERLFQEAYRTHEALATPTGYYALVTTHNVIHILRGDYHLALAALLPALALDEAQIVSGVWMDIHMQLAWCYCDLGNYEEAFAHCATAIGKNNHVNSVWLTSTLTILALLHLARGEVDEAEAAVQRGWESFDLDWQTYPSWWETLSILQAEAEVALARQELERADRRATQLVAKYDQLTLRHLRPDVLHLQARIQMAEGNREAAYTTAIAALNDCDAMGIRRDVWAICQTLSQLESERGNGAAADALRERARVEAFYIAEHTGSAHLRERFLAREDVRRCLETQSGSPNFLPA